MANEYRVYINTLIFALVSCGVLLALLIALIYVQAMAAYTSFIVTLAVGLLLVVAASIIRIAVYQRAMSRKSAILRDNYVVVKSCPDYYTVQNQTDGSVLCTNTYTTGDGDAQLSFSNGPASIDLSNYDKMTLSEVCASIDPATPADGTTTSVYNIPWTNMRSLCAGQE